MIADAARVLEAEPGDTGVTPSKWGQLAELLEEISGRVARSRRRALLAGYDAELSAGEAGPDPVLLYVPPRWEFGVRCE